MRCRSQKQSDIRENSFHWIPDLSILLRSLERCWDFFFFYFFIRKTRLRFQFNNLDNLILFVNYYWSVILNFFNAILYRFKFYTISLGLLCITILNVIENNDANYIIIVIYLQKLM